jgi:predicted ATPase
VFLAPPWPEIYVKDPERRHDFRAAEDEYSRLLDAYRALGYTVEVLPKAGVAQRADFIEGALGKGPSSSA